MLQKLNLLAEHLHLQMQILALSQMQHKVKVRALISIIMTVFIFGVVGIVKAKKEHLQSLRELQTDV